MTREQWKLEQMMNRLWQAAALLAAEAAALAGAGRGAAVVADETRAMAGRLALHLEGELFGGERAPDEALAGMADQLGYLALNAGLEAVRLDNRGKTMAVLADDVRQLATEMGLLLGRQAPAAETFRPRVAQPMTSVANLRGYFVAFYMGGQPFAENAAFVNEFFTLDRQAATLVKQGGGAVTLRGQEYPLLRWPPLPGAAQDDTETVYMIVRTPWAARDTSYAVAVDKTEASGMFACPVGRPAPLPREDGAAGVVRECWETEEGPAIRFVDWPALAAAGR